MYAQLSLYSQLIGSWRSTQRANAAAASVEQLYSFAWERDCVMCQAMDFRRPATTVKCRNVPVSRLNLYFLTARHALPSKADTRLRRQLHRTVGYSGKGLGYNWHVLALVCKTSVRHWQARAAQVIFQPVFLTAIMYAVCPNPLNSHLARLRALNALAHPALAARRRAWQRMACI